jgi:hypothetical protein
VCTSPCERTERPPIGPPIASRQVVRPASATADGAFDWADAGIGAAGAIGIAALAIGGRRTVTRRARAAQAAGPAMH